ncbi:sialin-like isoform X2 [Homarus americanus]|uniref:sialin-like isoform X2 n=1 Tax=Homarus americanus TaxID=6706 RepID=UPI001C43F071|nr:sialin-like isoform X2 [Homarus americanus]
MDDEKKCREDDRKLEIAEGNKSISDAKQDANSAVNQPDKPSNAGTSGALADMTDNLTDKKDKGGIVNLNDPTGKEAVGLPDQKGIDQRGNKLSVTPQKTEAGITDKRGDGTGSKSKDDTVSNAKLPVKTEDKTKLPDKTEDKTKLPDKTEDKTKLPDKTEDKTKLPDKTEDKTKLPDKTEDKTKLPDKTEDKTKLPDKTEDKTKLPDKTEDKPKLPDKTKLPDETEDRPKLPDKAEDKVKLSGKVDTKKPVDKEDEADSDVKKTNKTDKINDVKSSAKTDKTVNTTDKNSTIISDSKIMQDTHMEQSGEEETTEDVKQRLINKKAVDEEQPNMGDAGEETIPLKTKEAEDCHQEEKKDVIPSRWVMAVMGCIGFMIVYGLKVNLSVAIIAMVNHTAVANMGEHHDDGHGEDDHHDLTLLTNSSGDSPNNTLNACGVEEKKENLNDGPFAWDENVQGLILASYFYGYIITQVPGGWVAEKFSAKHVFGIGALVNAICALLSPVAANTSYAALIVIRIIMGIAGGVTLPGMHVLVAAWAPPQERSKIAATVYAGMTLGTLVCMPFSGLLASKVGWSSIFYVQGGLSLLWYILWLFLVYDSPAQHPRITKSERKFIEESLGTVVKSEKPSVPWKSVWTSMPVWAIIVAHTCNNWGWYMLLVKLPTYMRYILKFDIEANAGLSAVPFLCMWIFTMILANVLDALRLRNMITTTFARKLSTFIASIPPAICLICVTFVGCNTDLAVALLTLGTMFVGGMYSGFLSNHIDIAPPFAGTLMGISNTFATLPGIIVPSFVGYMTHGNQTVEAWRTIFYITLGIFLFEAIFYCIFGSGEQQEWAKKKPSAQDGEQQKLNDVA